MTAQTCSAHRDVILDHFINGTELRTEARDHYGHCVHCMTAVTAALCTNGPISRGKAAALPEAARRARDHGRQVLERAFGIRSANDPTRPE
jgi:hypothetical protein